MKNNAILHRILLLATFLLSSHVVSHSIEGKSTFAMVCYTIAFGVLMVASLLLIILGMNILENPAVVVVSTCIPLSLSLGLVSELVPAAKIGYLIFVIVGFLGVLLGRFLQPKRFASLILSIVHGVAGLLIFGLPILFTLNGSMPTRFLWVGVGGGLIGIGGMLLAFLKVGKPILPKKTINNLLPLILCLMSGAFAIGFSSV
jgi:hypothetical protein